MVTNNLGRATGPSHAPLSLMLLARITAVLKAFALIILLAAGSAMWSLPWTGIEFDNSGYIHEVAPGGPNASTVEVGDVITGVEGRSLHDATASVYGTQTVGEIIPYTIQRGDKTLVVDIAIAAPPWWVRLERSTLVAMSLVFIILGLAIFVRQPRQEEYVIFAIMCSMVAIMVSTMELTSVQVLWAAYLNQLAVVLSAATFVHFHLLFPRKRPQWRFIVLLAYLMALCIGSIYAAFEVYQVRLQPWYPAFYGAASLFLLSCFALSAALLVQAWMMGDGPQRRRIRLVSTGTLLTISLVIFLVIASYVVDLNEAILYKFAVWSLLFIPIAYSLALYRNDLFKADLKIHRILTYLLLILALLATHFVIVWMLAQLTSGGYSEASGSIASLFVAFSFRPLHELVERMVNRLVYGTAYNYLRVLSPAIDYLGQFNHEALTEVLTIRIPTALRVSYASLWMMSPDLLEGRWLGGELAKEEALILPLAVTREELERGQPLVVDHDSEIWQTWPLREAVRWVVPLVVEKELQGIWLIGQRSQDESFSPMDCELLKATGQAAALVIKGIGLVGEVDRQLMESQAARTELSQAYQMLTKVRERERHRLARELHDGVLQQLAGFRSIIEQVQKTESLERARLMLRELQTHFPEMIEAARTLCEDLRPTALSIRGLYGGVKQLVENLERHGLVVDQTIYLPNKEFDLDAETNLYQIVQEAFRNIVKHASATEIILRLEENPTGIQLVIKDNGCGFNPELIKGRRYGLLGIRERVSTINGTLTINSRPGEGTYIEVFVPGWALRKEATMPPSIQGALEGQPI